jgi:hypothetical protein
MPRALPAAISPQLREEKVYTSKDFQIALYPAKKFAGICI